MNPFDISKMADYLTQNWPGKYNDGDVEFWAVELGGRRIDDVLAALVRHKNTDKFTPKVTDIIRIIAASRPRPAARANVSRSVEPLRLIDWLRTADAGVDRVGPEVSDGVALAMHFGKAWTLAQEAENATDVSLDMARRLIHAHCLAAFMQIGFDASRATAQARDAVGLSDGERLPDRRLVDRGGPVQQLVGAATDAETGTTSGMALRALIRAESDARTAA